MNREKNNMEYDVSSDEIMSIMKDSVDLLAKHNSHVLSDAAVAYGASAHSNNLVNGVEFWSWMNRNFSGNKGQMFASNTAMKNYIAQGVNKENWFSLQLQGKGYEWDWMVKERGKIKNILNKYDAGDIANRAGTDVTKRNIISGESQEFQMKAYASKTNPNLKNTPSDAVVVTNAEKTANVSQKGFVTEEFQDATKIKESTNARMNEVKSGTATPKYSFKNVAGTMGKAGLIGCAVGIATETILSYRDWKNGTLSDNDYLVEVLKSGGDAGITGAATAGVMIPVSAAITVAGMSTLITLPVSFIVGAAINKVVAPCFGRGEYKAVLNEAKYYQNLDSIYKDMVYSMQMAADCYYEFVIGMIQNEIQYRQIQQESKRVDAELTRLYDLI